MKNLKNSVRSIVSKALEGYKADTKKLKELEAMRERYSPEYYTQLRGELETARRNALDAAQKEVDTLVSAFSARFVDTLDGAQLTDDAKLLSGGFPLTADDLHAIFDRSKGNTTMQSLVQRYADAHQVTGYTRHFTTAKEKRETASVLSQYARNAFSRPDYDDIWTNPDYVNNLVPDSFDGD